MDLRAAEFTAGLVLAKTLGRNSISCLWNLKQLQMLFSPVDFPTFILLLPAKLGLISTEELGWVGNVDTNVVKKPSYVLQVV